MKYGEMVEWWTMKYGEMVEYGGMVKRWNGEKVEYLVEWNSGGIVEQWNG